MAIWGGGAYPRETAPPSHLPPASQATVGARSSGSLHPSPCLPTPRCGRSAHLPRPLGLPAPALARARRAPPRDLGPRRWRQAGAGAGTDAAHRRGQPRIQEHGRFETRLLVARSLRRARFGRGFAPESAPATARGPFTYTPPASRLAARSRSSSADPGRCAARDAATDDPSVRELGARWLGASSASTSASTRAPPAASAAAAVLALQRRAAKARCGAQAEFQLRPTGSRRRVGVATRIRRAGAEFGICEPA